MDNWTELDSFKKDWQQQSETHFFSKEKIKDAINQKSLNNIRWVLIFSIIEFIIGSYFIFRNLFIDNRQYPELFHIAWNGWNMIWEIENIILFFGFLIFVILFYRSYIKIKTDSSVLDLTKQLINFRKIGNAFVIFNVLMFIAGLPFHLSDMMNGFEAGYSSNHHKLSASQILILLLVMFILAIFLIILYYKLIYGHFFKKIYKNQKELQELE